MAYRFRLYAPTGVESIEIWYGYGNPVASTEIIGSVTPLGETKACYDDASCDASVIYLFATLASGEAVDTWLIESDGSEESFYGNGESMQWSPVVTDELNITLLLEGSGSGGGGGETGGGNIHVDAGNGMETGTMYVWDSGEWKQGTMYVWDSGEWKKGV